jgi:hypothetical protein
VFSAAATARIWTESRNLEKLTIVFSVFLPVQNFKQGGGIMFKKHADQVFSSKRALESVRRDNIPDRTPPKIPR